MTDNTGKFHGPYRHLENSYKSRSTETFRRHEAKTEETWLKGKETAYFYNTQIIIPSPIS